MKLAALALIGFALTTNSLSAAPCMSAAFTTYTAAGYSCEVGGATFSNFSFFLQNATGGDVLDEADITVSPLIGVNQVGFRFEGDFQATGGPNGPGPTQGLLNNTYRFFFDVTRPDSVFTTLTSRLNDPERVVFDPAKFGDIFAANYASNDAASAIVHDDDPGLSISEALNSERVLLTLDNLISLTAGPNAVGTTGPFGTASLASADFLYTYRELDTPVPEPGTWALLSLGLGALFALRRNAFTS